MKHLAQKIILSLISLILLLTSVFVPVAHAADTTGTWYNQSFPEWYLKVYDQDISSPTEIFGERYTAAQVQWVFYSIPASLINWATLNNYEMSSCLIKLTLEKTIDLSDCAKGIPTYLGDIIGKIFDWPKIEADSSQNNALFKLVFKERPMSGIAYVKQKLISLKIIPEAKAQGFGYERLGMLQKPWKGARDFAFLIVIIITIVFAFMIMFRTKISPQTVITIQSALPKIAVTLILITFSYAIAGFLVDLLYVAIGIVSLLISQVFGGKPSLIYMWISGDIPVLTGVLGTTFLMVLYFCWYIIVFAVAVIFNFIATIASLSLFGVSVSIVAAVVWFLAIFMLLWYMIKVPWVLIKALMGFYINVILAPLFLGLGALLPSFSFGSWVKKILSNLSVFLLTGTLYYLALVVLYQSFVVGAKIFADENFIDQILRALHINTGDMVLSGTLWAPPLLSSGAEITGLILIFISFGIIAMMPKGAEIIQGLIEGKPISFGAAIGEAVAVPGTVGTLAAKYKADIKAGVFAPPSPRVERAVGKLSWLSFLKK